MSNEHLGIVAMLQDRRQRFARFIAPRHHLSPVLPKKKLTPAEDDEARMKERLEELYRLIAEKDERIRSLESQILPSAPNPMRPATIEDVQQAFCDLLWDEGYALAGRRLSINDLKAHYRGRPHAWPRHVCMDLASRICRQSSTDLGRAFGGRDHTSVLNAFRRVPHHLAEWPVLAAVHAKVLAAFEAPK
jgi:hypothetical protein